MKRSGKYTPVTRPHHLKGKTIGVVGLGHIGGSMIKRLSRFRPAINLMATDIDTGLARRVGRYCTWCASLQAIVNESDVVILAVHVPHIKDLLSDMAKFSADRTKRSRLVVADTGTIKAPVAKAAQRWRRAFDFVAMHPLAGSQHPGWDGSDASLFARRPTFYWSDVNPRSTQLITELIRLLDSEPIRLRPAKNDRFMALTIGLPHMLAYAAQGLADDMEMPEMARGRSWSSLTRVAASDPGMVAGFLSTNGAATSAAVRRFIRRLEQLKNALDDPSGRKIESLLQRWRRVQGPPEADEA